MKYRIQAVAAGHKSAETIEDKSGPEEPWHEDVFSDECPWPDSEDVKG